MIRLMLLTALAAFSLNSQETQRETPPPGSTPKPFNLPPRRTTTLKNRLRITTAPYGTIPKSFIRVVIRTGNVHEAPDQTWLADLMAAFMTEGSGSRTGAQLADEAARMGGKLSVLAGRDQTSVDISVLSEFTGDAINLVADVVQRPAFPESELARLKADLIRRLTVSLTTPQSIAESLFRKTLYPDHPYGRILPTEAMLKSYTLEHVRKFYSVNLGARRTHVYIAGRFPSSAATTAAAAFAKWTSGPEQSYPTPTPVAKKQVVTADRPAAAQSTIRLGLPMPDPTNKDYVTTQVTNALLGGVFMSRITSNIREQKGYTYSPFSALTAPFHNAYWVQNADITSDKTGPALSEIYGEIGRLRQTPPSEQELKGIQANMVGSFVMTNSTPAGIINQLAFVDLQGLGDDWLKQWTSRVNAVKPADIQRIAETYLNPEKMILVIVGDLANIKNQIAPFESRP